MNSHLRKEKNCLNCGAEVSDRYCPHCGQENLIPKETITHLIAHFLSDITHYDSRFLTTLRDLLFKPGFLTQEYFKGKRIRYLNPVRMYVFISFIFFIVLFTQKSRENNAEKNKPTAQNLNIAKQFLADSLRKSLENRKSSSPYERIRDSVVREISSSFDTVVLPAKKDESIFVGLSPNGFLFTLVESKYNDLQEYDSVQNSLPAKKRDDFIMRLFLRKNISIKKRLGSSSQISVTEEFQHNVPKLMFILLPLFALLLLMFYGRRKNTYVGHLIFSIHFHSFAFLLLMISFILSSIFTSFAFGIIILCLTLILLFIYLVIALKNVYRQSLVLSILKAMATSMLYILLLVMSLTVWALVIFFTA